MQSPVGVGDGVNFQQSGGSALFDQAWQTRQKPLAFDAAVNDDVCDVDVLWRELTCQAL